MAAEESPRAALIHLGLAPMAAEESPRSAHTSETAHSSMPSLVSSGGTAAILGQVPTDGGTTDSGEDSTASGYSGADEYEWARHVDELLGDAPRDLLGDTRVTTGTARRAIACVRGCLDAWRRQRLLCGRLRGYWIRAQAASMEARLLREAWAATHTMLPTTAQAPQAPDEEVD